MPSDLLANCTGFEWDSHNAEKIWLKHQVSLSECEQIFFNLPMIVADDVKHSEQGNRFFALGQTDAERLLFVVFTVRNNKIRVISARDMNRKERRVYQSHEEESA
ncbi:MAG TPA: BrnT family toxin [Thermodesulfovibrionales bacterium]|nr:BrnT family toxin [Thermodesulfovibrionales bacterium]